MNGLEANLVEQGGIAPEVLDRARERLRDGKDIGDVLLEMGALTADRWGEIVARYYGLPFVDVLQTDSVPLALVARLPIQFAKRHNLLPIADDGEAVVVPTASNVASTVPVFERVRGECAVCRLRGRRGVSGASAMSRAY